LSFSAIIRFYTIEQSHEFLIQRAIIDNIDKEERGDGIEKGFYNFPVSHDSYRSAGLRIFGLLKGGSRRGDAVDSFRALGTLPKNSSAVFL
jgi:hypothetical protein